jgi:endonuclease-3
MNPDQIETAFQRLREREPEPTTELTYKTPFELLIAVILSAQATDVSVNQATEKLYPIANTPQAIIDLGVNDLKSYIKSIGLFNTKAENIIKTCRMLMDLHNGQVPEQRESLEALPGVGRKTANVILNTAFGHSTIAVDTHIFRVSNRTGIAPGKNVIEVEKRLVDRIPGKYQRHAHHWLILLGRYTCIARNPKCEQCLISDICPSAFQLKAVSTTKSREPKTAKKRSGSRLKSASNSHQRGRSGQTKKNTAKR